MVDDLLATGGTAAAAIRLVSQSGARLIGLSVLVELSFLNGRDALPADDVHVGPSDYVPWLQDRKFCHIRMEGTTFGDTPLLLEAKLEVWDSPNSAGVVIDAIRCPKWAGNV